MQLPQIPIVKSDRAAKTMFSISDIFDKHKKEEKKAPESGHAVTPQIPSEMKVADIIYKDIEKVTNPKMTELYGELCAKAKYIYSASSENDPNFIVEIGDLVGKVLDLPDRDGRELLRIALNDYPDPENYFFYHVVNVCIIALELAMGLKYDRKSLVTLGSAAFLHDIGLMVYSEIIDSSKTLDKEDRSRLKHHPHMGAELLGKLSRKVNPDIRKIVSQEHERADGSGYPQGLKGSQIAEEAQIVGLADVYEALTHQRPYRNKYKIEAIKTILDSKQLFNPEIIKALLERIGFYPIGVAVRLNTKEVGVVVENNARLPFKPVIKIMYDGSGNELKEPKYVNLAQNSVIFIENSVD
jgi:HD-GYP domain-containing protein (c-di-GMP phosphodiesterase class II)